MCACALHVLPHHSPHSLLRQGLSLNLEPKNQGRLTAGQLPETVCDVGGDICCEHVLLLLVNKQVAFGQWLNREKPG